MPKIIIKKILYHKVKIIHASHHVFQKFKKSMHFLYTKDFLEKIKFKETA